MATKYLTEQFSGGVVDTRDLLYLEDGELSAGDNCYYSCNDDILLKVPQVTSLLASASAVGAVGGLQHVIFATAESLLTHNSGGYYRAPITSATGALGSWTAVVTGLTATAIPEFFTAIQHSDRYVLLDGLNTPQVMRNDNTCRRLGLKPVNKVMLIASATAATNVWTGHGPGYFDYWYTEVAEYGTSPEDITVESAYEATESTSVAGPAAQGTVGALSTNGRAVKVSVASIQVPNLATTVTLKIDVNPVNSEATHYHIYRSEAKEFSNEPSFPLGLLIGKVKIPTSSADPGYDLGYVTFIDGATTISTEFYPATLDSSANITNASAIASTNSGLYGDGVTTQATPTGNVNTANAIVSTFGITGISDPISDIEVEISASKNVTGIGVVGFIELSFNGGISWSPRVMITAAASATAYADYSTGYQKWGRQSISLTDVSTSNLKVKYYPPAISAAGVRISGLRIRMKHNGTTAVPITPYPGIVVQIGQDQFVTSKGGQPPVASVGTIYQGSLVTNDVNNKNMVRWSMAGELDAFPALYFFPVRSPHGSSEITFIGVVNNVCVVGMKSSIVRINYLPTENDSNFARDRIYDYISEEVGVLNATCARVYRNTDGREVMAVMTQNGTFITDGFSLVKVDHDFDFNTVLTSFNTNSNSVHSAARLSLLNENFSQNLLAIYRDNATTYIKTMNYAPQHIKGGGQLKMGGVWTTTQAMIGAIATRTLTSYPMVYLLGSTYAIYQIKPAVSTVASGAFTASTRLISISSPPSEYEVQQIYLYGQALSLSGMRVTAYAHRTEKEIVSTASGTTTASTAIGKVSLGASGEFMVFKVSGPADTTESKLGHITIEYDDQLNTETM